jgi:serine/threonine-protein kinase RsbT
VQSLARGVGRTRLSSVDVEIRGEPDIVTARGLSRQLAERMGFAHLQQVQITTVVSELARNIVRYAETGRVHLHPHEGPKARLEIIAEDSGPGIGNLDEILSGKYTSRTGLGKGLSGARQIMDEFDVRTAPGLGTVVRCVKVVQ